MLSTIAWIWPSNSSFLNYSGESWQEYSRQLAWVEGIIGFFFSLFPWVFPPFMTEMCLSTAMRLMGSPTSVLLVCFLYKLLTLFGLFIYSFSFFFSHKYFFSRILFVLFPTLYPLFHASKLYNCFNILLEIIPKNSSSFWAIMYT